MSPPIAGTLWREQASDDEESTPLIVDGHIIPKGTYVGVNTYSLHHNEVGISNLIGIRAACHFTKRRYV